MDTPTPLIQKLSPEEKECFSKSVNKWTQYNIPVFKERINSDIETDQAHQDIVRLCAKSFADTELTKKTGYEFYFAEPLIEFGSEGKGNCSFDLLLYNEQTHQAILISCKSSVSEAKNALIEIQDAKKLVAEKIEYLSECIGDDLNIENIEYVLCVYDKDSAKILDTLKGQLKKPKKSQKYDPDKIILWIYRPRSDIIQLHYEHAHKNSQLTELLLTGAGQSDHGNRFDLPCCYSSHPYRILKMVVVGDCYAKQYAMGKGGGDPKIIKHSTLLAALMRYISLGALTEMKKQLIESKMLQVIQYGKKYDVLTAVDEHSFRLNCRGDYIKTVAKSLEEKLIAEWSLSKAKEVAIKKATEEISKKQYPKNLFDYDTQK
jgi:hypothetical protein